MSRNPRHVLLYDFDHTVYNGDASVDFYLYCLLKQPNLIRFVPQQLWHMALYLLGLHERKEFKELFFVFLRGLSSPEYKVDLFWERNAKKLKDWYMSRDHSNDVIISASPRFLLEPIAKKIGVERLIATEMNISDGSISGKNCRGQEKRVQLNKQMPSVVVAEAYSDSLSDLPILSMARQGYVVRGDSITELEAHRESKVRSVFYKKGFLVFIVVGALNALIGVLLSYAASLFLPNGILAFIVGYSLSLIPSYYLNSTLVFKNRDFRVSTFLKFCVSYIPNFSIQLISVFILVGLFGVSNLISYIISVIIGIPLTFFVLSVFAFRKKGSNDVEKI